MNNNENQGCFQQIMSIIGCIFIFMFILRCFDIGTSDFMLSTNSGNSSKLTVIESHSENVGYGLTMICGKIKNNTGSNIGYAQVEINLYDKAGNIVGSTVDNIANLEPHSTWKFKAPVIENNVSAYKIKNVLGY